MISNVQTVIKVSDQREFTIIFLVLDVKDFYYLSTENLDCNVRKRTIFSYDDKILNQLPFGIRVQLTVVLTYKYACDQAVVSLLRSKTLGNSPTTLQHKFLEVHSEESMIAFCIRRV